MKSAALDAEIILSDDGSQPVRVEFTKDGLPYQFRTPAARQRAVIRALETAAGQARRLGDTVREPDLAGFQKSRADRLDSELRHVCNGG
jgi:hypothetical protein